MGLCSGTRFGCSGVTPEHVFSVPEHVFSAPEQKIFLRATRENTQLIFGSIILYYIMGSVGMYYTQIT